jgi:glycosyltransferase involved in cell wall biosynthesis
MLFKPSSDKIFVYHFSVGVEGGVHTIIKNIIRNSNSSSIDYKIIYLINTETNNNIQIPLDISHSVVHFSKYDNLYYTVKKIKKNLAHSNLILACHDWLELAMVSSLGLSVPVIFFLHGDYEYYYEMALKNEFCVTIFIVPTNSMKNRLLNLLPHREKDIFIQSYPVVAPKVSSLNFDIVSCAYYVADLKDPNKRFEIIPEIDNCLIEKGVYVNWNIGGGGMELKEFMTKWSNYDPNRIKYFGYLDTEKQSTLLSCSNIFILPSVKEGIPLSMVESMKSGLVPIVSNWNNSINEYIQDGMNGFIIDDPTPLKFATKIIELNSEKNKFIEFSKSAINSSSHKNNIEETIISIENIILKNEIFPIKNNKKKIYGSRLDHPLISNRITKFIRKNISKVKC